MTSADLLGVGEARGVGRDVPPATVARLPAYLRALRRLDDGHVDLVSSTALAEAVGVSPAQLRKDLSRLGSWGTRGVGYDVARLRRQIGDAIGAAQEWPVLIVGVGHLGTALANYAGFTARGLKVVALIDPSPTLVGRRIHGVAVRDLTDLEEVLNSTGPAIAVIATPGPAAQQVADRLVALGVTSILNFASTTLAVPTGVNVRTVDLASELQILAYHQQRREGVDHR